MTAVDADQDTLARLRREAELNRQRQAQFARRNSRAQLLGWASYGQMRYWLPQFGVHAGREVDQDQQRATARRLARMVCPENGGLEHRRQRPGSYFCSRCDMIVNGDGTAYAPDGDRRGDWRARLVRAAIR